MMLGLGKTATCTPVTYLCGLPKLLQHTNLPPSLSIRPSREPAGTYRS